jgi:hypothetical protein
VITVSRIFMDHRTAGGRNAGQGDYIFTLRWSDPDGTQHIKHERHKSESVLVGIRDRMLAQPHYEERAA